MPVRPSGPCPADILVVGEAPGEKEAQVGLPFVGPSGDELKRMLRQAGIDPKSVRFTNVFQDRPANNNLDAFCGKRAEVGKDYSLPPLSTGHYVLPEKLGELERLAEEVRDCSPRLIIPVGNTPCWALLRRTGISKLRGAVLPCELVPGFVCLPTFHPAAVLRDWSLRTIVVADLMKAQRYATVGLSVPKRRLLLRPTIDEVESVLGAWLSPSGRPARLSVDIETEAQTITCIGFAPSASESITVPFWDKTRPDFSYWPSPAIEYRAWMACRRVLESDIPKLGQNFLYDTQYLVRHGLFPHRVMEDTMILSHARWPEMEKGLGFLGSIWTDEAPWKLLRKRNKDNFKIGDDE